MILIYYGDPDQLSVQTAVVHHLQACSFLTSPFTSPRCASMTLARFSACGLCDSCQLCVLVTPAPVALASYVCSSLQPC